MREEKTAISVLKITKKYQEREVLKSVSFSIAKGMIYALLGSNGAGKTTTVRILTTQIKADSGQAFVGGYDVFAAPEKVHEVISLTGQFSAVDETLTGRENLMIMCKLYHILRPEERTRELLEYFGLSASADKIVATYSGGMKRKLDIAMSLVSHPEVLFLDEPTTGLDPQSRLSMWKIIQELKEAGTTIFLTTQYLEEAERLADKIGILDRGTIIAEGTPKELKTYLPQGAVQFTFRTAKSFETAKLLCKDQKISLLEEERKAVIFTDGKADTLTEIFHCFYENQVELEDFMQIEPNLEDVFLAMIEESGGQHDAGESKKIL